MALNITFLIPLNIIYHIILKYFLKSDVRGVIIE